MEITEVTNLTEKLSRELLEVWEDSVRATHTFLSVNEQNPGAKGFYEHVGFKTYKRSDIDEQGNPYPILYMKLVK